MSRVLVVQHTPTCPPARLGGWLRRAGLTLDLRRPDLGGVLPAGLDDHDALVVLGGEMNAYDDDRCPWLPPTRALLREAVARAVPTLAVCLGHQLLAVAAGGRVARSPGGPHLGVQDVGLTADGRADPLLGGVPVPARAVHWNSDVVVDLPPGAVQLATTPAGPQAYRLGERAWGVQFHPEVDGVVLQRWAAADVAAGRLVPETGAAVLAGAAAADDELSTTWGAFTDRFAALASRPG